jgi:tetratricopeptide (TPR) repeat protein
MKNCPNLTLITSGIILLYSLLFFPICPSPNLAFAIAIELGAFLLIAVPMRAGNGFALLSWPQRKLEELEQRYAWIRAVQNNWRRISTLIAFSMISLALIDLSALWMAVSGLTPAAVGVYSALPVSYLVGGHPALSLEMLTGACVESHQYERAEELYRAVLQVRKNIYGENHPMVAALYADLGDLNKKMMRPDEAEKWYLASMNITEGHGRALHSLANLLRDSGDKQQSEDLYKRALALRAQFFGKSSTQYQATLHDYQSMADQVLNQERQTR